MQKHTSSDSGMTTLMANSIMSKGIIIIGLILLLLIPFSMLSNIISERETISQEAIKEVHAKWAEEQLINGPILSIPVVYQSQETTEPTEITELIHILPEDYAIAGTLEPQKLRRGIYEVVVYTSRLEFSGSFALDLNAAGDNVQEIKFDQAFITLGISDLRGIQDKITLSMNNRSFPAQPGSNLAGIPSGVTFQIPVLDEMVGSIVNFGFSLNLQGSQHLDFVPTGATTTVQLASNWDSPSFNGSFLPDGREISEDGFVASWKILQLNRNFPQSWRGPNIPASMKESAFGVNLLLPLDDYQKTMRSVKYAIMTIVLTFLIFFLVEILYKRKIHPLQYTLVGLALCLFFVLLLSISEHLHFNVAYMISTVAVISMIALYSIKLFKVRRLSLILCFTLIALYAFLFVNLQLTEYALLMGSTGLTLILAATMYFTRDVNWYQMTENK
ncbi:MAG: cell envelope integrity protein CreD [Saprospiraceae bacterium]|nr:cell envelope integrity protein CreD [Lewinella sp.]